MDLRSAQDILSEKIGQDVVFRMDGHIIVCGDLIANDIVSAMKIYAEQALEAAALNAKILETTTFSESRTVDTKSHINIINSCPGILKTIRVDKGTILIIKQQLK